jgi:protein translocase SecG subunit|tara:strand:- start:59 stop:274 length:216 start_codon:yes stop_codon:yes gene_type:complete
MLQFFSTICSCALIILILLRIPQTNGGAQNFNLSGSFLGSPKNTDQTLQNIIWFLTLAFLLSTAILTLELG